MIKLVTDSMIPKIDISTHMLHFVQYYDSPLGRILLVSDDIGLIGVSFDVSKHYRDILPREYIEQDTPSLAETKRWLDEYFMGREPNFMPRLHIIGSVFRLSVWQILLQIPYGQKMTYGDIARLLAAMRGIDKMSAQAVGNAIGHNRISIIIPCHRVVGVRGDMIGYDAGVYIKEQLLKLEHT